MRGNRQYEFPLIPFSERIELKTLRQASDVGSLFFTSPYMALATRQWGMSSIRIGYCFTQSQTRLMVSGLHIGGITPAEVTTIPR